MAWPIATDFQSVMQNMQGAKNLNFKTDYLQNTYPEPGAMGLPYMDSGNFAVVFLRNDNNSAKKYGIRCPTMEPLPDQEERYAALDTQMQSIGAGQGLSFLISFLYHQEEIFYDKVWYPAIEMEWVQGASPLNVFVEDHLNEPDILHNIAMQFKISIDVMQMYEIAHGDIQHGNVLIDQNGVLKYVDYDDFFIASAMRGKGMHSFGEGMAHYQHPERTATHFETYVDLFPAIVVYLSIGAIATDPGLFKKYNSDENLIFKKSDFQNPGKTAIWNDLKKNPSDVVLHLTEEFQGVCRLPIDKTPSLNEVLKRIGGSLPPGKKIQPAISTVPQPVQTIILTPMTTATTTVPVQPTPPAPVLLPRVVLPVTNLPFGDVRVGQMGQKIFAIQNLGTADLHLQSVSSNSTAFTVQTLSSRTVTAQVTNSSDG